MQNNNSKPFDTLLVANRGEIACRVIRSARDMGLRTVAVYSEADADAPHVQLADVAVLIGAAAAADSYLNVDKILAAAESSGAGAIHPGYGFLSENADFARAVEEKGLRFVGPPADAVVEMGDKAQAKRHMLKAGVPCIPGYQEAAQDDESLLSAAAEIGLPLMVKAAAGGGGRGMRFVNNSENVLEAIQAARAEGLSAFGSDVLILERAITQARHVEVQVFADSHGNCIHLGERDCSVQRRHQKVLEESPCPVMTEKLREEMGAAAVAAAQSVQYCGAGTVEFLLDNDGNFYFLEMNTRLQVEHPVTEMVTGLDLVELQLRVAQGEVLPLQQSDISLTGHSIEARLYAEDPSQDFLPCTGEIVHFSAASGDGVRVDAGVVTGQQMSPWYDPMVAKVIVHAESREAALQKMHRALTDTVFMGPACNTEFLLKVLSQPEFATGQATTDFLDNHGSGITQLQAVSTRQTALAAALYIQAEEELACSRAASNQRHLLGWSSGEPLAVPVILLNGDTRVVSKVRTFADHYCVNIEEQSFNIVLSAAGTEQQAKIDGQAIFIHAVKREETLHIAMAGQRLKFQRELPGKGGEDAEGNGMVTAPMPGLLVALHVEQGAQVKAGDKLAVLEAMKMQHPILADIDGELQTIAVKEGQQVETGALLFEIVG